MELRHPERFDPRRFANTLMYSEHWGRYCWAAQALAGKRVLDAGCGTGYGLEIMAEGGAAHLTGVDIDAEAVAESRTRADRCGVAAAVQGDLQALELPDDSFDAAVCFETIEHIDSPERGMAELRRVVRPGGMVIVSSPNPEVYPEGNEHHLHELRPDQLRRLVGQHFPAVRMYLQHAWLASMIEPAERAANGNGEGDGLAQEQVPVRRNAPPAPNGTTFAIAVGCDGEAPEPSPLVSIGDSFEVKWWQDRLAEAEQRAAHPEGEADSAEAQAARADAEARRALEAEGRAAQIEARAETLAERLEQVNGSLIDANQKLAQMPLLKHRLAEIYEQRAGLEAQVHDVLGSRSWQLTSFLRKARRAIKV